MRILVPSAGAASSISVIKEARRRKHFVLATDLVENTAGEFLADDFFVSGMCYEEPYVNYIIEMCQESEIEFIIPINDAELPVYNMSRRKFEGAGIHLLMNPSACVQNGHNKEKSWRVCEDAGIRQPIRYFHGVAAQSWRDLDSRMPPEGCFPLIAKPPMGVGGRGQHICRSPLDVKRLVSSTAGHKLDQHLWQEYIHGEEYSVDCWGDPNTDEFVAVPRTRGKIINGQATGGMAVYAPDIVDFVRGICQAFDSNNVCCVQVMSDGEGKLYFIEFNPRYGTGVSLSFEAGIDFLELQLKQCHGIKPSPDELTYEAGVGMTRYWQEKFYREGSRECPPNPITQTVGRTKD
jgi:carbamoyl-phosphate synthase large subunit